MDYDHQGALVISLDFELIWGMREKVDPGSPYIENILGARKAIPALLDLFDNYKIAGTWAIVGLLFADSSEEQTKYYPQKQPSYIRQEFNPYQEAVDGNERTSPLYFGHSLVELISKYPNQEIASHTFGHYYCLEPGQTVEEFDADCASFSSISKKLNATAESIVFPRNQWNSEYANVLKKHGILAYRGNQKNWAYQAKDHAHQNLF